MFRWLNKCESCNFQRLMLQQKFTKIKCSCLVIVRTKSYYEVLGLDSTASPKDIKSAYYRLSLQYHPDKNDGSPESVTKFREITEAYEILSNPENKMKYDNKSRFQTGGFQSEYSRQSVYNRSYNRPNNNGKPFTGKTKEFDYDEHFRRHYQEFQERRQAEHEYFKRRWEAEFYRRYPDFEEYYKKRHYEKYNAREELSKVYVRRRFGFLIIFSFWMILLLMNSLNEFFNPNNALRPKPLYYKVDKEDNDKHDNKTDK